GSSLDLSLSEKVLYRWAIRLSPDREPVPLAGDCLLEQSLALLEKGLKVAGEQKTGHPRRDGMRAQNGGLSPFLLDARKELSPAGTDTGKQDPIGGPSGHPFLAGHDPTEGGRVSVLDEFGQLNPRPITEVQGAYGRHPEQCDPAFRSARIEAFRE